MQLALWDFQPAEFIVSGFTSGAVAAPFDLVRRDARECVRLLDGGVVDVALVPTLTVLRDPDKYDVLPAVALSTWSYPYAQLVLRHDLGQPIRSIAFDPRFVQEALLTRILLGEHYRFEPVFVPYETPTREALLAAGEDASLIVGSDVPMLQTDRLTMDLGQEWYELANYPMVWGVFATRKGEATPEMIKALRAAARAAEQQRGVWLQAQETLAALHAFYSEDLRVRFDDLAVASLTELRQYLFYYKILDEIPDLPMVSLPEEEDDEEDQAPLL